MFVNENFHNFSKNISIPQQVFMIFEVFVITYYPMGSWLITALKFNKTCVICTFWQGFLGP